MIIIQANGAEGELEEKILALLRREDIAAERVSLSSRHTLTFPELTIDGRSQQAFQNGTALALTRIEFNMLLFLASNPGVTLSKAAARPISARSGAGTCSRRSPPPPEVPPSKQIEARASELRSPAGPRRLGTATRMGASLSRRLSAFFGSTSNQDPKAAKFAVLTPGRAGFPNHTKQSEGSDTPPPLETPLFRRVSACVRLGAGMACVSSAAAP